MTYKGENRLKILYNGAILDKNWGGGEPIAALETINGLKELGYEVHTSYYNKNLYKKTKGIRLVLKKGSAYLRSFFYTADSSHSAVKYYMNAIKNINPDIIISQYDYDTSIIEAAKQENKKIIMYAHIWWPICPKITLYTYDHKICSGFTNNNCKTCIINSPPFQNNKNHILSIINFLFKTISKLSLSNKRIKNKMKNRIRKLNECEYVIVLSNHMKNLFVANGVKENKVVVMPNGVNTSDFIYNTGRRAMIVLYMGGDNELKGYNFFKDLALTIKKIIPDARFIATGNFDTRFDQIEYTGMLNRNDLKKLISEARVTFVPSVWDDPFPHVTLESIASGTPVVAFDIGILSEIIKNGQAGFVVNVGNIEEASSKVLELLTNDDLFSEMSKNSREIADKFYPESDRISLLDNLIT